MFHTIEIGRLDRDACRAAILRPLAESRVRFGPATVATIAEASGGYPFFIQYISRDVYDAFLQGAGAEPAVPLAPILRKLDADFFAGRWNKASDRQRELLRAAAALPNAGEEFTVAQIVARSKALPIKSFSPSHCSQLLAALTAQGLVYRNRHGRYLMAVPLLHEFIRRQFPLA
jgi:hypothetical protein